MAFSRIIKIKLKFFKSMQNKITEKYQLYFFSFILEKKNLKEKRLKDYTTQQHFNSERKEKEGRKRRKKEKEKKKKIDYDRYWYITYIVYTKFYHTSSKFYQI